MDEEGLYPNVRRVAAAAIGMQRDVDGKVLVTAESADCMRAAEVNIQCASVILTRLNHRHAATMRKDVEDYFAATNTAGGEKPKPG